ncbi:ArnT family glycosyltransferase [Photorhabdus stackebrandtii]|uniref:Glycosyltransferase n=1 Tax=Photorhabdus stackebrandtii TaxID=1123042 RepID=A0A7X5QM71_9GAMM|nr:glycosyltransferase family 39 protein [Photorhabdus stackebrandtii]NHB96913.1 glycosyltransferase [Photorhabdus stackebrandtii]
MLFSDTSSYKPVYLWVISYALLWIIVGYSFDPTVPYDAVEALNWGKNGEWGSPKNPWLVGAMILPAIHISGISLSFYWYFIHFIAIAIGMLGVWHLAFRLTGKKELAWLAMLTLNLSGIINFDIIPYNDNYLLIMLWPWIMLFFLRAVYDNPHWWIAFALSSGLATMGKYSSLALVGSVFLLTLFVPRVRQCYRQPALYIALVIWFMLVLPNVWWLWNNDFAAFKWVDSQINSGFNLHTTRSLLSVFYPLIIVGIIIYTLGGRIGWPKEQPGRLANMVILLPLLIIYCWFSFNKGGRMTEWLQPFMSVSSALLVGSITRFPQKSLLSTLRGLAVTAVLVLMGYVFVMAANVRGAGHEFEGIKDFSWQLDQRWQQLYSTPLHYVGGEYLHQWLTFYAPSQPDTIQPWTLEEQVPNIYNRHVKASDIIRDGAILIGGKGKTCEQEDFHRVLQDWPKLKIKSTEEFLFQPEPETKPIPICVGFVSPEKYQ